MHLADAHFSVADCRAFFRNSDLVRGRGVGVKDDVQIDDAGEIEVLKALDADGATAPETLRHQELCRQDDLERGALNETPTEGDVCVRSRT